MDIDAEPWMAPLLAQFETQGDDDSGEGGPQSQSGHPNPLRTHRTKDGYPDIRVLSQLEHQRIWLRAYAETGQMLQSCKAVGITYDRVRQWRRDQPAFLDALQQAHEAYADTLEQMAMERLANHRPGGHGTDQLLIELLRAHRPQLYGRQPESAEESAAMELLRELRRQAQAAKQSVTVVEGQARELPPAQTPDPT